MKCLMNYKIEATVSKPETIQDERKEYFMLSKSNIGCEQKYIFELDV